MTTRVPDRILPPHPCCCRRAGLPAHSSETSPFRIANTRRLFAQSSDYSMEHGDQEHEAEWPSACLQAPFYTLFSRNNLFGQGLDTDAWYVVCAVTSDGKRQARPHLARSPDGSSKKRWNNGTCSCTVTPPLPVAPTFALKQHPQSHMSFYTVTCPCSGDALLSRLRYASYRFLSCDVVVV